MQCQVLIVGGEIAFGFVYGSNVVLGMTKCNTKIHRSECVIDPSECIQLPRIYSIYDLTKVILFQDPKDVHDSGNTVEEIKKNYLCLMDLQYFFLRKFEILDGVFSSQERDEYFEVKAETKLGRHSMMVSKPDMLGYFDAANSGNNTLQALVRQVLRMSKKFALPHELTELTTGVETLVIFNGRYTFHLDLAEEPVFQHLASRNLAATKIHCIEYVNTPISIAKNFESKKIIFIAGVPVAFVAGNSLYFRKDLQLKTHFSGNSKGMKKIEQKRWFNQAVAQFEETKDRPRQRIYRPILENGLSLDFAVGGSRSPHYLPDQHGRYIGYRRVGKKIRQLMLVPEYQICSMPFQEFDNLLQEWKPLPQVLCRLVFDFLFDCAIDEADENGTWESICLHILKIAPELQSIEDLLR
jgi:hypothetical protein